MRRLPRLRAWLFGSRRCPRLTDSTEDWAVGDIAECIVDGVWRQWGDGPVPCTGPRMGDLARVVRVVVASPSGEGARIQTLSFSRFGATLFQAACFRKVQPRADEALRADPAFIASLKPARIPAPAESDRA